MSDKQHFAAVIGVLADGGLLPRALGTELVQHYDFAVGELAKEAKPSAEAQAVLDAAGLTEAPKPVDAPPAPGSLGSFGILNGTLTVTSPMHPSGAPIDDTVKPEQAAGQYVSGATALPEREGLQPNEIRTEEHPEGEPIEPAVAPELGGDDTHTLTDAELTDAIDTDPEATQPTSKKKRGK